VGFQIGGQAIDVVMLIMNQDGMRNLSRANSSWARMPPWPQARSGGMRRRHRLEDEGPGPYLFARPRGIRRHQPLGAVIKQDKDATREFYGRMVAVPDVVDGKGRGTTDRISVLNTLAKWAKKVADKDQPAGQPAEKK